MRIRLPGLYIVLGLVLAGLIHIVAVLTLPLLAPKNAHARLAALGPANTMIELPPAAPGRQVMPMMAPDVRYAFCGSLPSTRRKERTSIPLPAPT